MNEIIDSENDYESLLRQLYELDFWIVRNPTRVMRGKYNYSISGSDVCHSTYELIQHLVPS